MVAGLEFINFIVARLNVLCLVTKKTLVAVNECGSVYMALKINLHI